MRALHVERHGEADVLAWADLPQPAPGPGELLVRVSAFAVNWADVLMRRGRYPGGPTPPFVSGHDLVGVVAGRAAGVSAPPVGTRVFGVLPRAGAAAEFVTVPASLMYPVADRFSDAEAAGLASPYLTADAALVTMARFQRGESVLVHAAAGGFGSAAVQLARAYGAGLIVATAGSAEKLARVKEWGADVLVDYTSDDFVTAVADATGGRGVDIVVESVGGDVLGRSFDCLAPGGRLTSVGASSGRSSDRFRLQTLFKYGVSVSGFTLGFWMQHNPELVAPSVTRVLGMLDRGEVQPVVARVFDAADVAEAHTFLESRRAVGRVVVRMNPG